jgi:hypothetical protein
LRRFLALAMIFSGLLTVIGGIAESSPRHTGLPEFHIIMAIIFIVLSLWHIWLNRKVLLRYFGVGK